VEHVQLQADCAMLRHFHHNAILSRLPPEDVQKKDREKEKKKRKREAAAAKRELEKEKKKKSKAKIIIHNSIATYILF